MANISSGEWAIAVCGRCQFKVPYTKLAKDPNSKALMVCPECLDQKDPYRLPARQPEPISLKTPRPDVRISTDPNNLIVVDGVYLTTQDGLLITL